MKIATLLPYVIGAVALGAVLTAFAGNASPYVDISQARKISGDRLHLAGHLVKGTTSRDISTRTIQFDLRDDKHQTIRVVYTGEPISLAEADQIVAIGKCDGNLFRSEQLLVKCPSRYEGDKKRPVAMQNSSFAPNGAEAAPSL